MDELNVIDLRQYALHPGRREELIDLFDREFVETQEAGGMVVLGQFRDLDDPDSFVWMRAFHDMPTRKRALTAFYDGPVWAKHGVKASATMIDSSNARLLSPLSIPVVDPSGRAPVGAPAPGTRLFATVWAAEAIPGWVQRLYERGPAPIAVLATLEADNNFPRLPIRTDGSVVVAFTREEIPPDVATALPTPSQVLHLTPTGRSLIQ